MPLTQAPSVRAEMLIRRPAAEVYQAFADPAVTTHFWFSRASGPLVAKQSVIWYWDDYGVSAQVQVDALEPNQRIALRWPRPTVWTFSPRGDQATMVVVTETGFERNDEGVAQAIGQMGGHMLVLASCKAWLEHGIALNAVGDKNPDAHV